MKYLSVLFVVFALLTSCGDDDSNSIESQNRVEIENYLQANNLTAQHTSSGLYYIIQNEGTGARPTANSHISVIYTGRKLSNGEIFDQTTSPRSFNLNELIPGWKEGLPKITAGGEIDLFVPAHLAYGSAAPSSNGVIAFNINLLSVN